MSKYWMEVEQKPEDKGGSADRQVCILSVVCSFELTFSLENNLLYQAKILYF